MIMQNLIDLDAGSFCYNDMAESGCGGSPSPMAMLMTHDDDQGEDQALYHTADGDNESDMERLYVNVCDTKQKQQQLIYLTPSHHALSQQEQQQQHLQQQGQQQHYLHQSSQHENSNQMSYNNWCSHNSSIRSTAYLSYWQMLLAVSASLGTNSSSSSSPSVVGEAQQTPPQMHYLHPLHQQHPSSDSEMIYTPSGSMASERSLLSNSGSSTCGGNSGGTGLVQSHNV